MEKKKLNVEDAYANDIACAVCSTCTAVYALLAAFLVALGYE